MATLPADSFTIYSLCLKETTTPNRGIHMVKVSMMNICTSPKQYLYAITLNDVCSCVINNYDSKAIIIISRCL